MQTSSNLNNYNHKHAMFTRNGLAVTNGDWNNWTSYFYTESSVDKKTAKEIFEGNLLYVSTRWDNYIANLT